MLCLLLFSLEMAKFITIAASAELRKAFNEGLILRFGVLEILITDKGQNIMSQEFQEYLRKKGIKHQPTSAHHQRSDGQTKRFKFCSRNRLEYIRFG